VELTPAADLRSAQLRYARVLGWGTATGLALLVIAFIAYVAGWIEPHIPIERLPQLWSRPAPEMLAAAGLQPGWGWATLLHRADMLVLVGIAVLASCSIPCLAAVIPVFRARGETTFVVICALQIAILVLAASGVLAISE
jgi:hypothetical protein